MISKIDKNFIQNQADKDTFWVDANSELFNLYGVFYDNKEGQFVRVPSEIAKSISDGISYLSTNTAGGRITFRTNSTKICIKCSFKNNGIMAHMPIVGSNGFSVYVNGKFYSKFAPAWTKFNDGEIITYDAKTTIIGEQEIRDIKIYFPLYSGICEFFIGVDKNAVIEKGTPYKCEKPVVYYGSSITQGGCASRPGNDYASHIERWLDVNYVNLGFSGNAQGQLCLADYITTLNPSVVVMDYDYNAPSVEHLENTHYPFYKRLRDALPNTPIIFISLPDFYNNVKVSEERRAVIYNTYLKSVEQGDKLTSFIDGETLFGKEDYDACTVDGTHPNDLGFYRMAKVICPVIEKFIK